MKKKRTRRTKRRTTAPAADRAAAAREDLNLASSAMLADEGDRRSARTPRDDASVQDPLLDWPDD